MSWTRLRRVTAPATSPVTLAEAKDHVRSDIPEHDDRIQRAIDAATADIDGPNGIGIAMISQQWKVAYDGFPSAIRLPIGPVISVDEIAYTDPDGVSQTVASFQSDLISSPARLMPDFNTSWPQTRNVLNAVEVTFTAGFGATEADVPSDLRAAVLLLVGHYFENAEAVVVGSSVTNLPMGVSSILERYRVGRFG